MNEPEKLAQRLEELESKYLKLSQEHNELTTRLATLQLLKLGIETIEEGVTLLNDRFEVEYTNPAYRSMYGWDEEEFLGKLHPGMKGFVEEVGEEVFDDLQNGCCWTGQRVSTRSSGTEIITEQSINPAFSDEGLTAYVVVVRDITERTKMELSLLHSQKLESIGQLAAGIAHEINTPAQYVGDNMHFIRESWGDIQPLIAHAKQAEENRELCDAIDLPFIEEELPNALEQALNGIQQISSIVLAMKNFAHPGETTIEPVDINASIENVILIAKNEWKYLAEIETELASDAPTLECMPSEVNQVMLNIIVNAAHAIEATGQKELGRIKIKSYQSDEHVFIEISDTGIGMDKTVKRRIFDPFFTTKSVGRGTGQGLSIAFGVMEKHSGTIDVDSEPGRGTTFKLKFPRVQQRPNESAAAG